MSKRGRHVVRLAILLVAALAGACASSGPGRTGGDQNVLTYEEIQSAGLNDLHAVISRLRPRWLQARSQRSLTGGVTIGVIVDGVRDNSGVNILYNIRSQLVERVAFMNANDAQTRYGGDLQGGAILVTMRR